MKREPIILSIETSCDETAAAVTLGRQILSNVVWSQIAIHRPWGGVVPSLAKRAHQEHIDEVVNTAIKPVNWQKIDAVAVTAGPGLAIALEVGIKKAKEIAEKYKKPLIAVDHMEGHLLSSLAKNFKFYPANGGANFKLEFPALGLLVSGGHTELVLVKEIGQYQILGQTLDDAAGEAFDKVAKMLGLGYPGGPIISQLAEGGDEAKFDLPVPMVRSQSLNFSFSGLKTACLYKLKEIPHKRRDEQFIKDFAASFQSALVQSIVLKLKKAIERYHPQQVLLGGGVINNLALLQQIKQVARQYQVSVLVPYSKKLLTDNAAMIGVAAYYKFKRKEFVKNINKLDRKPNLSLEEYLFL